MQHFFFHRPGQRMIFLFQYVSDIRSRLGVVTGHGGLDTNSGVDMDFYIRKEVFVFMLERMVMIIFYRV